MSIINDVNQYIGAQYAKPQSLAYAATVTPDMSKGTLILIGTLTGTLTLANPTNLADGMVIGVRIKQDGTGGRTVTLGSKWKVPSGTAFSTAAGKVDWIWGIYCSDDDTIDCGVNIGIR